MEKMENCAIKKQKYLQRIRKMINDNIDILGKKIPEINNQSKKISRIGILHYSCIVMKRQHYQSIEKNVVGNQKDHLANYDELTAYLDGFVMITTKNGHLLHATKNICEFLKLTPTELLLGYDRVHDIISPKNRKQFDQVLENMNQTQILKFLYLELSIPKKKLHLLVKADLVLEKTNSLVIIRFRPILQYTNRDNMISFDSSCFTSVHSLNLKFKETCQKCEKILELNQSSISEMSLYSVVHNSSLKTLETMHQDFLNNNLQPDNIYHLVLLTTNGSIISCLAHVTEYKKAIKIYYQVLNKIEIDEFLKYTHDNPKSLDDQQPNDMKPESSSTSEIDDEDDVTDDLTKFDETLFENDDVLGLSNLELTEVVNFIQNTETFSDNYESTICSIFKDTDIIEDSASIDEIDEDDMIANTSEYQMLFEDY